MINVCLNIILSDDGGVLNVDGPSLNTRTSDTTPPRIAVPPVFCAIVIKLTAMQMQALGDQFTLEHICGGMSVFPSTEKSINMLLNLILPLCIRMGCGRKGLFNLILGSLCVSGCGTKVFIVCKLM